MISCIINTYHIELEITSSNFFFEIKKLYCELILNETFMDKKLKLNKKAISKLQLEKIVGGDGPIDSPELGDSSIFTRFLCTDHPTQRTMKCPQSYQCPPQQSVLLCG